MRKSGCITLVLLGSLLGLGAWSCYNADERGGGGGGGGGRAHRRPGIWFLPWVGGFGSRSTPGTRPGSAPFGGASGRGGFGHSSPGVGG